LLALSLPRSAQAGQDHHISWSAAFVRFAAHTRPRGLFQDRTSIDRIPSPSSTH
jgi:hypothetical protein